LNSKHNLWEFLSSRLPQGAIHFPDCGTHFQKFERSQDFSGISGFLGKKIVKIFSTSEPSVHSSEKFLEILLVSIGFTIFY